MPNSEISNEERAYDEEPYESHPVFQMHPARIAAIARIYGLQAPTVEDASILELGCAAGGNLIPLAHQFPNARFVGIDISGVQINEGRERIHQLGLKNIMLRKASISDMNPEDGLFDYILTHGVYSWVPPKVREDILRVAQENLGPTGVAYISYNTLPGWHLKTIIRDTMRFHRAHMNEPPDMESTRDLLSLIAQEMEVSYGKVVAEETRIALNSRDFFLKHDFLERWNIPCYVSEFLAAAKTYRLGYLQDADTYGTISERYDQANIRKLQEIAQYDPSVFEQYLDFYTGRMFRMSLLIHEAQLPQVRYTPVETAFESLHFTCAPLSVKEDSDAPLVRIFEEMEEIRRRQPADFIQFPIIARTIEYLLRASQHGHHTFTLSDIVQAVCPQEASTEEYREVRDVLIEMFQQRMLSSYAIPLGYTSQLLQPSAFPLARLDAMQHRTFTNNIFHQRVDLSPLDHLLLPLLNGTNDHPTLISLLEPFLTADPHLTTSLPPLPESANPSRYVLEFMLDRYVGVKLL